MKKSPVLVYILVLIIHLASGLLDMGWLRMVSKPLLLLILGSYFFYEAKKVGLNKFSYFILFALIFSLTGDVLLLPKGDGLFVYGLTSFLVAHIFYILAFNITYLQDHEIAIIKRQGWVMVLIIAYGYLFFNQIKDHLGEMVGPVMLYVAVITLMLLIAVNRYKRVGKKSFQFVFFGAVLFVFSDSVLSWNMFVSDIEYSHLAIMGTYGLAQLFISLGAIEQVHKKP